MKLVCYTLSFIFTEIIVNVIKDNITFRLKIDVSNINKEVNTYEETSVHAQ